MYMCIYIHVYTCIYMYIHVYTVYTVYIYVYTYIYMGLSELSVHHMAIWKVMIWECDQSPVDLGYLGYPMFKQSHAYIYLQICLTVYTYIHIHIYIHIYIYMCNRCEPIAYKVAIAWLNEKVCRRSSFFLPSSNCVMTWICWRWCLFPHLLIHYLGIYCEIYIDIYIYMPSGCLT